jgi:hypothetical protein
VGIFLLHDYSYYGCTVDLEIKYFKNILIQPTIDLALRFLFALFPIAFGMADTGARLALEEPKERRRGP